jgi:hypothetical protein
MSYLPTAGYEADANGNINALYYNNLLDIVTIRQTNFLQTRATCNAKKGYNGTSYCLLADYQFGITIKGKRDWGSGCFCVCICTFFRGKKNL